MEVPFEPSEGQALDLVINLAILLVLLWLVNQDALHFQVLVGVLLVLIGN